MVESVTESTGDVEGTTGIGSQAGSNAGSGATVDFTGLFDQNTYEPDDDVGVAPLPEDLNTTAVPRPSTLSNFAYEDPGLVGDQVDDIL